MSNDKIDAPPVAAFVQMIDDILQKQYNVENDLEVLRNNFISHIVPLTLEGNVTTPPARVLFASPVTGKVGDVFGGDWFIATNYAEYYTATGKGAYHTGCDLNRPGFADSGAPVYAAADGDVVVSRIVPGWQGVMVVIKHTLEDGRALWTRYAHLKDPLPTGQTILHVKRGDVIGKIGDYTPVNDPRGDHCHYDVSWHDLGQVAR